MQPNDESWSATAARAELVSSDFTASEAYTWVTKAASFKAGTWVKGSGDWMSATSLVRSSGMG
jgi:hypothetical protein